MITAHGIVPFSPFDFTFSVPCHVNFSSCTLFLSLCRSYLPKCLGHDRGKRYRREKRYQADDKSEGRFLWRVAVERYLGRDTRLVSFQSQLGARREKSNRAVRPLRTDWYRGTFSRTFVGACATKMHRFLNFRDNIEPFSFFLCFRRDFSRFLIDPRGFWKLLVHGEFCRSESTLLCAIRQRPAVHHAPLCAWSNFEDRRDVEEARRLFGKAILEAGGKEK